MLNTSQLSECGVNDINANNPSGLLKRNGKIYQLKGFLNYMDGAETADYKNVRHLMPLWAVDIAMFGYNSPRYKNHTHITVDASGNGQYEPRLKDQIRSLGLDPSRCFVLGSSSSAVFVFSLYEQPLSFMTKVTKNPRQALFDYASINGNIPQLMTDYRLAHEWANARDLKQARKGYSFDYVDIETLHFLYKQRKVTGGFRINDKKTIEEIEQEESERLAYLKSKESPVVKFSDYEKASARLGIDLFSLNKRIVSRAKRLGGFVEFAYKDQVFNIPKIPLIAWAIQYKHGVFEYNGDKWRAISDLDIKTSDDNQFHSDWWIGAGIPLDAYNCYGHSHTHQAFNIELANFAADLVKRNQLDNFTVLAGGHLTPITGNLHIHPSSVDVVKDGDVIVLPNANVEFDAYLKKACSSGKGAVIVEVGNGAAHLSIVARELGYRVIQLPNATNLLMGAMLVFVDTQETIIKRIEPNTNDYKIEH